MQPLQLAMPIAKQYVSLATVLCRPPKRELAVGMPQAIASSSGRSMAAPAMSIMPRLAPRPCGVYAHQQRAGNMLRPSAARPLGALWRAQQIAAFRHSALCAATAPTEAPAETFQYQAEVKRLLEVSKDYEGLLVCSRQDSCSCLRRIYGIRAVAVPSDTYVL